MQVLLVLGAAGGVGLAAVQIGKVCGAIVIAVARYVCMLVQAHMIFRFHGLRFLVLVFKFLAFWTEELRRFSC